MNQQLIKKRRRIDVFLGELSACDHCVQIYEDDGVFLDALEGFVAGGIRQGDAIVLIATPAHLAGLASRLELLARAFGEMVALMWAEGHCGATVRQEHMWSRLCAQESFSLFCAYPKAGFTENAQDAIARVCAAHSRLYAV